MEHGHLLFLEMLGGADAGERPIAQVPLYLDDVAAEAVEAVRTLAEQKHVQVEVRQAADLQEDDEDAQPGEASTETGASADQDEIARFMARLTETSKQMKLVAPASAVVSFTMRF